MRPQGRAKVSQTWPEAFGVCDFCGFQYNLKDLRWEMDWRGPRITNLRFLVCETCLDKPQMNGQRTYILPPDPVPVMNARPEMYVPEDNAYSTVGADANWLTQTLGNRIGNMINYGNLNAAFDGNVNKPLAQCATISVSNSSFNNYVGINWQGNANAMNYPSSLQYPVATHSVVSFTIVAPFDATIGSTAFVIQGSMVAPAPFGGWTTIYSGTPAGTVGETLSGQTTGDQFQFHRAAFWGSGGQISVAQVSFSVGETGQNEQ